MSFKSTSITIFFLLVCLIGLPSIVLAHGVDDNTKQFLLDNQGVSVVPFLYIGAKHMVTGYDHGVVPLSVEIEQCLTPL